MHFRLIIALILGIPIAARAQYCGFSEGKNLAELRVAVFAKPPLRPNNFMIFKTIPTVPLNLNTPTLNPIFLPEWSAESLPFFCKIEHVWAKKGRIPFKFRLGSVEYVDWLEGK